MYNRKAITRLLATVHAVMSRDGGPRDLLEALTALAANDTETPANLWLDAHVALASLDPRHLLAAVRLSERAGLTDRQPELLGLARRYGAIRAVHELITPHTDRRCPPLPFPEFAAWFEAHGLFRFDLYEDRQRRIFFMNEDDAPLIRDLIATRVADPDGFWKRFLAAHQGKAGRINQIRHSLLERLAHGEETVVRAPAEISRDVEARFAAFCAATGRTVLSTLQRPDPADEASGFVFTVQDRDGIAKVFKQRITTDFADVEPAKEEAARHAELAGCPDVPRCFGETETDTDLTFLRLERRYGQPLADYIGTERRVTRDDACTVIGRLAGILRDLHQLGVAHLDVRPANVLLDGRGVSLLDLGESRRFEAGATTGPCRVHDPRYAAPETVRAAEAGPAADLFALGIIFHELVTGRHPFAADMEAATTERQAFLAYTLGNARAAFDPEPVASLQDPRLELIPRLLARDPAARPTAQEVLTRLRPSRNHAVRQQQRTIAQERGTVVFPARIGVPHQGHLDFLGRLLELGYRLEIALHHAYRRRRADPLHKWVVAKMLAKGLARRGFDLDRVRFRYVPVFHSEEAYALFCATQWAEAGLVGVASGNPEAWASFPGLPILDQRLVFGREGEPFWPRSWGATLRQAIREDERAVVDTLLADGVTDILSYEDLRRECLAIRDETYAWDAPGCGKIYASLIDEAAPGPPQLLRVSQYGTPEGRVLEHLPGARWIDAYARERVLVHDGKRRLLCDDGTGRDTNGHVLVRFRLRDP